MLEERVGQFWNLHQLPLKNSNPDFRFSSFFFLMIEDFQIILQLLIFSPEKNMKKNENRDSKFS